MLDDHLHHSKTWPKRLHEQLGAGPKRGVRAGLDLAGATRSRRPGHRQRIRAREALYDLTVDLAARALDLRSDDDLADRLAAVLDGPWTPALDATVLVLPSGLRSFDQHPLDMVHLASLVAARLDPGSAVCVVGVRTSGSYLGPLLAAALRQEGVADVGFTGLRPDDHLDAGQRAAVHGAVAIVVDDPPVSGESIGWCADLVGGAGAERVVVALALDDPSGALPPALVDRDIVVLPAADWYLAGRFEPDVVRATLAGLVDGPVGELTPVAWPGPGAPVSPSTAHRDHRRAAFEVDGRMLLVESVGQGFFGRHNAAVAEALAGRVPEVVGFEDGVLFQWLPVGAAAAPVSAEAVVDHLVARHRALPVDPDPSADFEGRQSVVEVATELLAGNLGPLGPAARIEVVESAVRRMLAPGSPSVIDGRVTLDRFLTGQDGRVIKLDPADGAFSHRDLATYDPAFDVAQLAETPIGADVRAAWGPIEPERWLLHRLVHRWDRVRHRELTAAEAERISANALQDYLAEVVLPAPRERSGPWVALDVDGVLEGPVLDASAPGRTGATALAALLAHDHRVALVTGRSVADVGDRVAAWGLAGGVAEYGTALLDGDTVVDLRSDEDRRAVDRLRAELGELVDPGHTHAVRTTRPLTDGELAGLDLTGLTVVPGEGQTDFVPDGCTKVSGFRALTAERPAMAVGDGPADLDLLDLAGRGFLPRHAASLARAGHRVTAHAYQAGLADAVTDLLGHVPGTCPTCAVELDADARFVLAVLSLKEAGARGLPSRLLAVATSARRAGKGRATGGGLPVT